MSKTAVEVFIPVGDRASDDGETYPAYLTIPAIARVEFNELIAAVSQITLRLSRLDDDGLPVAGADNGLIQLYERKITP